MSLPRLTSQFKLTMYIRRIIVPAVRTLKLVQEASFNGIEQDHVRKVEKYGWKIRYNFRARGTGYHGL